MLHYDLAKRFTQSVEVVVNDIFLVSFSVAVVTTGSSIGEVVNKDEAICE